MKLVYSISFFPTINMQEDMDVCIYTLCICIIICTYYIYKNNPIYNERIDT